MKAIVILAEIKENDQLNLLFSKRWQPNNENTTALHALSNDFIQEVLRQSGIKYSNCKSQEYTKQFAWQDNNYLFHFNQFNDSQHCYLHCSGYELKSNFDEDVILSKQFLTRLTDTMPDMLWSKDVQGRYLFANQAICDNLLMCTKDEVIGNNDVNFALRERARYPENPQWHTFGELCFNSDEVVLENLAPQRFEEFGHIKGEMTYLEVHKAPFYDEDGVLIGTVGAGRDITQQKLLESSLNQASNTIDVLMEVSLDSLVIFDQDLHCKQINPNFTEMTGFTFDEVKQKSISEFFTPESQNIINQVQSQEKSEIHRLDVITKNKTSVPCMLRMRNLTLFGEDNIRVVALIDISEQVQYQEQILQQKDALEYQAHYDALTQLPNRTFFITRLNEIIQSPEKSKHKHALLFIDLDHFKQINDSFGHNYGDNVLLQISERLKSAIPDGDTLARLGGDEFVLLLENIKDEACINRVIDKLNSNISSPIITNESFFYITLSIGISIYPSHGTDTQNLIKNADSAMYKAKEDGRNTYRFYTEEMTQKALERLALENNLRNAIKDEAFEVFYQPQYNGKTNQLLGMEALIRWPHPTLGMISPANFIPLAEETGLIVDLDRWVMNTATEQVAKWYAAGLKPGRLSLNLTMKQIKQKDLLDFIKNQLATSKFEAQHLELEVTESQIMQQPETSIEKLNELKKLGISISIDDFGTGYSSLSQLKRLPVQKLKIDRSFIMDLPHDEEDAMLTKTIIGLAKNLKLDVIAEGVETQEQEHYVLEQGCENIQGYFFSKPLSHIEMEQLLQSKI